LTTLVSDLEERGLLNDVLVIAMGEFGRTPRIGTQGSTRRKGSTGLMYVDDPCRWRASGMGKSLARATATAPKSRSAPSRPATLPPRFTTTMGVSLDATYVDFNGRPRPIIDYGQPIHELI